MVSQEGRLIPCSITRSAFSGERIVKIQLADFSYRGAVPLVYCFNQKGESLDELTPAKDSSLDGLVRLILVRGAKGRPSALAMPDGSIQAVTPEVAQALEA